MSESSGQAWSPPEQHTPSTDSFDLRAKSVEAWLSSLPLADLDQTSRALYKALTETNRLRVDPELRLAFLERVGTQVRYVVEGLSRHYSVQQFPPHEKGRKTARISLALLRELATGYLAIVSPACSGRIQAKRKTLARAMYETLRCGGQLLVEHYALYQPAPAGVWRRLHWLHSEAAARGLAALKLPDPELRTRRNGTIAERYKRILLLAALDPYRMRPNQAVETDRLLERWAAHIELLAAPGAPFAVFHVDPTGDAGPRARLGSYGKDGDLALDTWPLTASLDAELSGHGTKWAFWKREAPAEDAERLSWLRDALATPLERQYPRHSFSGQAQLVIGLSGIYRTLAGQLGTQPDLPESQPRFESREVASAESDGPDAWQMIDPAELLQEFRPGSEHPRETPPQPSAQAVPSTDWSVVNTSAEGYCVMSDPSQAAKAQVGELVIIREEIPDGPPGPWQAGVIRWLKHAPGVGLHLGIQVLAPDPVPVVTRPQQGSGFGAPTRALLLPEVLTAGTPVSLITSAFQYAPQRKVLLETAGTRSKLLLTRQLEATAAFCRFEFHSAGQERREGDLAPVTSTL